MDEFEKRIQQQALRKIPGEWRAAILAAANSASRPATRARRLNFFPVLLWPNQKAWGCLATAWVFIFALNFFMRDEPVGVVQKASLSSTETILVLRQQEFLIAELFKSRETPAAEEPRRFSPKPRSERRGEILNA